MKIAVLIAFGLLLFLNIFMFLIFLKKSKNCMKNEIRFPISLAALVFVLVSFLSVFLGFEAASSVVWSVSGGISIAVVLSAIYAFFYLNIINSNIIYDDKGFINTDLFGRKKEYSYSDITSYYAKDDEYRIRCGRKTISYFSNTAAAKDFFEKVKNEYSGDESKEVLVHKDIFLGNLNDPVENTVAVIVLFVIGAAAFLSPLFIPSILVPPNESELVRKELNFSRFEEVKQKSGYCLYLYSDGEEYAFKTKSYNFISDVQRLADNCNGKTNFIVLYKPKVFVSNANEIYGISDESGFIYYSPKDLSREEDAEAIITIVIVIGILSVSFAVFVLYAGRNPERINGYILYLLFGKDGINVKK